MMSVFNAGRPELVAPSVSGWVLLLIAVVLLLIWVGLHLFRAYLGTRAFKVAFAPIGIIAVASAWCALQGGGRMVEMETNWRLDHLALFGGVILEILGRLYGSQARTAGRRWGPVILLLRSLAVGLVLFVLTEPVRLTDHERRWQRQIAIVVDHSESMSVIDQRSDATWALRLAEAKGLPVAGGRKAYGPLAEELRGRFSDGARETDVANNVASQLAKLGAPDDLVSRLRNSAPIEWMELADQIDELGRAADDELVARLGKASSAAKTMDDLTSQPRIQIAQGLLQRPVDELRERYGVRVFLAGDGLKEMAVGEQSDEEFALGTDHASALDAVLAAIPEEELAGCAFVGDGRDNSGGPFAAVARGFRARGAPVATMAVGSLARSMDLAVVDAVAAPRVWQGDEALVDVDVRLTGIEADSDPVEVILSDATGAEVARETIQLESGDHRSSHRFSLADLPSGTHSYTASIALRDGEQLDGNNQAHVQVKVVERDESNDDRVDVLLADGLPRWEFRYLRNLFNGRDETVALTHVLLHPKEIAGIALANPPRLPATAEEWSKFDVLMLGDIGPEIDLAAWNDIEQAVSESGSLLVLIAGRNSMPHRILHEPFLRLLPVRSGIGAGVPEDEEFRIDWTPEGELHDLMLLDVGLAESRQLWSRLPPMRWRRSVGEAKDGAEILAYARPIDRAGLPMQAQVDDDFTEQNALIVTQRFGRGRVVLLCADRSWRMRYGVGDRFHHRFWWRMIHWQDEEVFGDDSSLFAVHVERTRYEQGEDVLIKARALDANGHPMAGAELQVRLDPVGEGSSEAPSVVRELKPRAGSPGISEVSLSGLAPGTYEVVLAGGDLDNWLADSGTESVKTELTIDPAPSLEFVDLRRDEATLRTIARESGGRFLEPAELDQLATMFGPAEGVEITTTRSTLWDHWLVAIAFTALLFTEWAIRRWRGLA